MKDGVVCWHGNSTTWYRAFSCVWPTIKWPWKLRFLKYPLLTGFCLTSPKIPRMPPAVRRNQFAYYTAYSPSPTHSYPPVDIETYSKSRLRLGNKNQNFSLWHQDAKPVRSADAHYAKQTCVRSTPPPKALWNREVFEQLSNIKKLRFCSCYLKYIRVIKEM